MKLIIKILALSLILSARITAAQWNSTGELIMAVKTPELWPPLELVRPHLSFNYDTPFFRIHYDKSGIYAVYHPDEDINPNDGVPDYINRMSEYLEAAYNTYSNLLGFDEPPLDNGSGGNDKYDIYVTDITGLTVPDFPSDYYPGRAAYAAYTYIGCDLRTQNHPDDPLPFLQATCAHEIFHAFQMAYRAYTSDETDWWYELTANWAEERVFDELNEIYYYLPDYYRKVDKSLYLTGGGHTYGAWVFAEFLSENYGNSIIERIFEQLITFDISLYAIEAALVGQNVEINNCFANFARWNYFTAQNWRPGFFEEGFYFPETVPITLAHYEYPTGQIETPKAVENLGCAYFAFYKPALPRANLNINFGAGPLHPLNLSITTIYNNQPIAGRILRIERGNQTNIRLEDFEHTEVVVMVVYWPYEGVAAADSAEYYYSAEIDTITSSIGEQTVGIPGQFELRAIYPNPFNSSCLISFSWAQQPTPYSIKIYDITGREVDKLDGNAQPGLNNIAWRPSTLVGGGVYFCRLSIDGFKTTGKLLYLK
jgi:hypothetical protein